MQSGVQIHTPLLTTRLKVALFRVDHLELVAQFQPHLFPPVLATRLLVGQLVQVGLLLNYLTHQQQSQTSLYMQIGN
ncbi:MAG: hypothetical protein EBU89_03820 [Actinobacteria bacterium]|nr:hypothetical protein [Actinomycetota bacterium]